MQGKIEVNFEEVFNKYKDKVFRLCYSYTDDIALSDDLTQETFIRVWENLSRFRREAKIGTWIYRIASNVCFEHFRHKNRLPTQSLSADIDIAEEEEIDYKNEIGLLHKCIVQLPEAERIIISMVLEGESNEVIADVLGITSGYMRVKIHRIKNKLTQLYKKHGNV